MNNLKPYLFRLFGLWLLMLIGVSAFAQCEDDTTPPIANCREDLTTRLREAANSSVYALVYNYELDMGSYDECTGISVQIVSSEDDIGTPPGPNYYITSFDSIADYSVVMYVIDEAENFSTCTSTIHVIGLEEECPEDFQKPSAPICINGMTITIDSDLNEGIAYAVDFLALDAYDNCDDELEHNINLLREGTGQHQGVDSLIFTLLDIDDQVPIVEVWVVDDFGNSSKCETYVLLESTVPTCDPDEMAPLMLCRDTFETLAHQLDGINIEPLDIKDQVFDLCTEVELSLEHSLDPSETMPSFETVNLPSVVGDYPFVLWARDATGNTNHCSSVVKITGIEHLIEGQVYKDVNDNCILDEEETNNGLGGWTIRATNLETGQTMTTLSLSDGSYQLVAFGNTIAQDDFQVELILPDGLGANCSTSVILEDIGNVTEGINFATELFEDCTYLSVDLSTPFIRRCFSGYYYINYVNYSGFDVENATINIELDSFLDPRWASRPYSTLESGEILFDLGTLAAGEGGQIRLNMQVSCDVPLGATHCTEATILPFTCEYDEEFAELQVTGECDLEDEQVRFTLTNIGNASMSSPRSHIIIEDVVMYLHGEDPLLLDVGEEATFDYPANGATWRFVIEQDDNFPFGGSAVAFVEGCGGFTSGMATQFTLTHPRPNIARDCQENIGSWDPNDKQAFPKGYGNDHFIEANTAIDYLIRFQNTGTDTAFNVRVEDQLGADLDYNTIVPGASSHPYRMELKEDGHLLFHFDNIMLPDSNVNPLESNGFVKFQIDQLADNPIGTVIENTAAIYFDFNEAVITNTVFHTIGEEFVIVASQNIIYPGLHLRVAPNPLQSSSYLLLEGYTGNEAVCEVFDSQGVLVFQVDFRNNEVELKRSDFGTSGMYFYRIVDAKQNLVSGKLIVH